MKRAVPFWPTLLTAAGIIVLCSLGAWQLQRLQWKTELLTALQAAQSRNAVPTVSIPEIETMSQGSDLDLVRYVFVEGQWLHDKEIALGPRTWESKPGYHIITPLQMDAGTLLVNRGWVPLDQKENASHAHKSARIMGLLRRPSKANPFTPANNPHENAWYRIDLQEIAAAKNLENLAPLVLYTHLDTNHPELPVAQALAWQPNNNHLQYAIFWFTMAGILLVIYVLRFIRKT